MRKGVKNIQVNRFKREGFGSGIRFADSDDRRFPDLK